MPVKKGSRGGAPPAPGPAKLMPALGGLAVTHVVPWEGGARGLLTVDLRSREDVLLGVPLADSLRPVLGTLYGNLDPPVGVLGFGI